MRAFFNSQFPISRTVFTHRPLPRPALFQLIRTRFEGKSHLFFDRIQKAISLKYITKLPFY